MRLAGYKKYGCQLDAKTSGNRVSVATSFTQYCPLLLGSDVLSLSPSFLLHGKLLRDVPIGATHKLRPPGDVILSALQYGITFGSLCGLAEELGITEPQLIETLGFLNRTGALRRRRTLQGWLAAMRHTVLHASIGTFNPALSWRQRLSYKSLAYATLRATWPVTSLGLLVAVIAIASGVISTITGLYAIGYALPLFVSSIYVHELAHTYVLRLANIKTDVMQLRLRLSVMHRQASRKIEFYCAIAGPSAGVVLCVPGAIYGFTRHILVIWLASVVIAFVHLAGLLPLYGDGASLRKLWQSSEVA